MPLLLREPLLNLLIDEQQAFVMPAGNPPRHDGIPANSIKIQRLRKVGRYPRIEKGRKGKKHILVHNIRAKAPVPEKATAKKKIGHGRHELPVLKQLPQHFRARFWRGVRPLSHMRQRPLMRRAILPDEPGIEKHQLRAALLRRRNKTLQRIRPQHIVAVEKINIVSPRQRQSRIARARQAAVLLMHSAHTAILRRVIIAQGRAAVRGAVVDQEDFQVFVGLPQQALHTGRQKPFHTIHRHDHADQRLSIPHWQSLPAFFSQTRPYRRANSARYCRRTTLSLLRAITRA